MAGSQLCAFHAGILEGRSSGGLDGENLSRSGGQSRFPLIYRIAAGLLLLFMLMEVFQVIRDWFN